VKSIIEKTFCQPIIPFVQRNTFASNTFAKKLRKIDWMSSFASSHQKNTWQKNQNKN